MYGKKKEPTHITVLECPRMVCGRQAFEGYVPGHGIVTKFSGPPPSAEQVQKMKEVWKRRQAILFAEEEKPKKSLFHFLKRK